MEKVLKLTCLLNDKSNERKLNTTREMGGNIDIPFSLFTEYFCTFEGYTKCHG
jgi:hypothetical protein